MIDATSADLLSYLYTAAWRTPENLKRIHPSESCQSLVSCTHNVPASPELVKMPDRLPSSPALYHLSAISAC